MPTCIVCDIAAGVAPAHVIHESNALICFLDHRPINAGHLLLCPRDHHADLTDLPDDVLDALFREAKCLAGMLKARLGCAGVSLMQNNGRFNELGHFHLHLFPRYQGDGFGWVVPDGSVVPFGDLGEVRRRLAGS
jgi:histidine triad (HIT) family protein